VCSGWIFVFCIGSGGLGTGGIDIEAVPAGASSHVKWWIIEQDESRRAPLESIEISLNYLKRLLAN
jgi:hypothetical protein